MRRLAPHAVLRYATRRRAALRYTVLGCAGLAIAALVAAAALSPPAGQALAQSVPRSQAEISLSFAPVVKRAAPAVVNVYASTERPRRGAGPADRLLERFFGRRLGRPEPPEERSLGSGVIIGAAGLVVTNAHVVSNATAITVVLADRREYAAEILLSDDAADLAVLQLQEVEDRLPTLPFGDADALEVGDLVLAIGNPFGVGQTVTSGIISAQARTGASGQTFIQTDAAINPGNSGGALVDMAGRLVGVNSAILTRSGGSNGVGFAIPAGLVKQAVAQAARGATELSRPWLGIKAQTVDASIAASLGLKRPQGVLLTALAPQSPFKAAGLEPGAVVLAVEGEAIDDLSALTFRVAALGVGATAEVETLIDGRRRSIPVKLIEAPETPARDVTEIDGPVDLAGIAVATLNPGLLVDIADSYGQEMADRLPYSGVVVLGVARWARRTGLRFGDVVLSYNGRSVDTAPELDAAIRRSPDARSIEILRNGRQSRLRYDG